MKKKNNFKDKKIANKHKNKTSTIKNTKEKDTNISKKYPNGRTLKTKDEYLPIDKKGHSTELKEHRRVVIIDSNNNDELAVVRLTTKKQSNTNPLKSYKQGNFKDTHFRNFVEIVDNEGKPIKIDKQKFIENPWDYDLSVDQVKYIKDTILSGKKQSEQNNKNIIILKSRGKKNNKKN